MALRRSIASSRSLKLRFVLILQSRFGQAFLQCNTNKSALQFVALPFNRWHGFGHSDLVRKFTRLKPSLQLLSF